MSFYARTRASSVEGGATTTSSPGGTPSATPRVSMTPGTPGSPGSHRKSTVVELIQSNHFASLCKVQVDKELTGTEVQFADVKNPPRVMVNSVGEARDSGVREGDVVVAFAGRALQRRHKARDLEAMKAMEEGPNVTMLLWGLRGLHSLYGHEFGVYYRESKLHIEVGEVPCAPCMGLEDSTVIVVIDRNHTELAALRKMGIERGDVVIGVNYEPVPDTCPPKDVVKRIEDHLMLGPIVLNFWRCTDDASHAELQRSAIRAARIRAAQEGGFAGTAAQLSLQTEYCVNDCNSTCTFSSSTTAAGGAAAAGGGGVHDHKRPHDPQ